MQYIKRLIFYFYQPYWNQPKYLKKKKVLHKKKKQHIRVGSSQFWIRLQCCKNIYILLKNGRLRLKVKAFKTDDTAY
jgi:hypothetical protein